MSRQWEDMAGRKSSNMKDWNRQQCMAGQCDRKPRDIQEQEAVGAGAEPQVA